MNIVGGLARLFTVLHYGIGVVYVLLFSVAFGDKAISTFTVLGSIVIVTSYYVVLEVSPDAKQLVGDAFLKFPLMTGLSLLWTDFIVCTATGFYILLQPFWPPEKEIRINWVSGTLIWLVPIALMFSGWKISSWVAGGFRGRDR